MRIIEPHIHMFSRTTDDYYMMAAAGIECVVEPTFWLGSDRTSVSSCTDYYEHLITVESARAIKYGIDYFTCIGHNAKEANNLTLANEVVDNLEPYLQRDRVVAVGEIGFDLITDAEEEIFRRQLKLAVKYDMPAVVHTPHQNKRVGTEKILNIVKEEKLEPSKTLVDHNTEETIAMTLNAGVWAGLTIYPITKLSSERAVQIIRQYGTDRIMLNSSADWGYSDPLLVPKTVTNMRLAGFSKEEIKKVVFHNPYNFYKQSPKFTFEK
jgi:Predicted metal-dependent hydrolases with the TIM-barrel fold